MIRTLIIIGSGSFIGGISRYLLSYYISKNHVSDFPWGTFIVNIIGCLLIGFFYGIFDRYDSIHHEFRIFLTIGLCGGFTTFSTFSSENLTLINNGDFLQFALYSSLSVFLGILATFLGIYLSKFV